MYRWQVRVDSERSILCGTYFKISILHVSHLSCRCSRPLFTAIWGREYTEVQQLRRIALSFPELMKRIWIWANASDTAEIFDKPKRFPHRKLYTRFRQSHSMCGRKAWTKLPKSGGSESWHATQLILVEKRSNGASMWCLISLIWPLGVLNEGYCKFFVL